MTEGFFVPVQTYTSLGCSIPRNRKNGSRERGIIDLGSGDGLMANYLGISSKRRKVFGIELNKSRLIESDKGVKNVKFKVGDILKSKIYKVDVILLIHVFIIYPA